MNYNSLFKLLIDIAFYLLIPAVVLFPGAIIYFIIFPGQQIIAHLPYSENGVGWQTVLILFIIYVEYLLFFIGFYNLRKFAGLLLKNKIFTVLSVQSSKKIGWFFTACGASCFALKLIYDLFFSSKSQIEFNISDSLIFLFLIVVGGFFLILSNAFERTMKLEVKNNSTIQQCP